jgi:UDP-sulfoquinovose synthase
MKSILILGGDGYLGWPTAMFFSNKGYEVTVVDNYFRRHISNDINADTLYSVPNLVERSKIWYEKTGYKINVVVGDLTCPDFTRSLFTGINLSYLWPLNKKYTVCPDTVIHYAEQPSAPYSLMNYKTANFTLTNNLLVTNNLMFAVKDLAPEVHIIKLGTMGEYGTPNIDIEEGWLEITHKNRKDKFLFPRQAGSIYHTSKIMDTDLMWFGVRTWDLKITDLMQGPVYGIETEESLIDERLRTIFNYDEVFGTIVNRFITQTVAGYPLTVYGSGNQVRGYLNIKDTLQCVYLSEINPAKKGELKIFNQIMETLSVNDIANIVSTTAREMGYDAQVKKIENPRVEQEEHYYNPTYQGLQDLGVQPHLLTKESVQGMLRLVESYKKNINSSLFHMGVKW